MYSNQGRVLERDGHSEAIIDIIRFIDLNLCGILFEITFPDATLSRKLDMIGAEHDITIVL